MDIKTQMGAELTAAKSIAAAADTEKREMTPAEVAEVTTHLKAFEALKGQLAESQSPEARAIADQIAGKSAPATPAGRGLKDRWAAAWAEKAEKAIRGAMGGSEGQKALVSGSVDVPSIVGDPVQTLVRPTSVLDLIKKPGASAGDRNEGAAFQFLRQTGRVNNAGAVADGALKPTSTSTFTDVEDRFRVYAALSEALPLRYLSDFKGLVEILRSQLGEGLFEALENDVIGGTGSGEGFTGILNTSGIQTQAFVTGDLLATLSNAKWKVINAFVPLTGWALTPADLQKLELLRDTTGRFLFDGREGIEKFLGGPVVTNAGLTAGTALVGDWDTVELLVREDDHVDTDTGGSLFDRNQFKLRVEGRYGLKVGRPSSFVKVATA